MREIARSLERSPSTEARSCGATPPSTTLVANDGDLAHSRALERLERPRGVRVATEPGLRAVIQSKLNVEWSLEQIAARRSRYIKLVHLPGRRIAD